jgi:hypothetical protein
LSSVAITLSSERAISAWLAGDGADAVSGADAPDAAAAGATVALLIRLCNAGMTGVLVPAPAACAPAGVHAVQRKSATTIAAGHMLSRLAPGARAPRPIKDPIRAKRRRNAA